YIDLGRLASGGSDLAWRASSAPRTPRQEAYLLIWRRLRALPEAERADVMAVIRSQYHPLASRQSRPLTRSEVGVLVEDGLVSIGAHCVTHPSLTSISFDACRREIAFSKADCETLSGAPVSVFAYPYGDFDRSVQDDVKAAGFAAALSIQKGPVAGDADLL